MSRWWDEVTWWTTLQCHQVVNFVAIIRVFSDPFSGFVFVSCCFQKYKFITCGTDSYYVSNVAFKGLFSSYLPEFWLLYLPLLAGSYMYHKSSLENQTNFTICQFLIFHVELSALFCFIQPESIHEKYMEIGTDSLFSFVQTNKDVKMWPACKEDKMNAFGLTNMTTNAN